jgi:hypothetical protein
MLKLVIGFALGLSVVNWVAFIVFAAAELMSQLRARRQADRGTIGEHERVQLQALAPDVVAKLAESLGKGVESVSNAATNLKKAGPAASAAALSFGCLLIALIAAGLELVPPFR